MSKTRTKRKRQAFGPPVAEKGKKRQPPKASAASALNARGTRETIESIAIAVILAFLFRQFEAEAFVIPTGSMAPTLMGQHIDMWCPKCGLRYQGGASGENNEPGRPPSKVTHGTCPNCRYPVPFDREAALSNQHSFIGDRILVSKFAYDLRPPERYDVIVFKYPNNPDQNYIKRLVGLPGEELRIWQGDAYYRPLDADGGGTGDFRIARKPPHKVPPMLQLVYDTDHVPQELLDAGWPTRWQERPAGGDKSWKIETESRGGHHAQRFSIAANKEENKTAWLRYRHALPTDGVWGALDEWRELDRIAAAGKSETLPGIIYQSPLEFVSAVDPDALAMPDGRFDERQITKGAQRLAESIKSPSSEFNLPAIYQSMLTGKLAFPAEGIEGILSEHDADDDGRLSKEEKQSLLADRWSSQLVTDFNAYNVTSKQPADERELQFGMHWVGDLAIECSLIVESDRGRVHLDLVEGGVHFTCSIDVATGKAKLSHRGGDVEFGAGGQSPALQANTAVKGQGVYHVRFANVDDALLLWVNGEPISFSAATAYVRRDAVRPRTSQSDPGDLEPAGIGAENITLRVENLRLLRDIYYIALDEQDRESEYSLSFQSLMEEEASAAFVGDMKRAFEDVRRYLSPASSKRLQAIAEALPDLSFEQNEELNEVAMLERSRLERENDLRSAWNTFYRHYSGWASLRRVEPAALRLLMVRYVFAHPELWNNADLFERRREVSFRVPQEHFFPMGDNSAASSDARIWGGDEIGVHRNMLTGKALFIYWPHGWNSPLPFWPNFDRMNFIR